MLLSRMSLLLILLTGQVASASVLPPLPVPARAPILHSEDFSRNTSTLARPAAGAAVAAIVHMKSVFGPSSQCPSRVPTLHLTMFRIVSSQQSGGV